MIDNLRKIFDIVFEECPEMEIRAAKHSFRDPRYSIPTIQLYDNRAEAYFGRTLSEYWFIMENFGSI